MHIHNNTQIHTLPNQVYLIIDVYLCDAFGNMCKPDKNCQRVWACLHVQYIYVCPSSSQKTCTVPFNIHHKLHVLPLPLSLAFQSQQNRQTHKLFLMWNNGLDKLLDLSCWQLREQSVEDCRRAMQVLTDRGVKHTHPFTSIFVRSFILIIYYPDPNPNHPN